MTLIIVLTLFLLLAVAAAIVRAPGAAVPPARSPQPLELDAGLGGESAAQLSLSDPVEALLRYGTPADAARLEGQGVDLAALGFRPPGAQ